MKTNHMMTKRLIAVTLSVVALAFSARADLQADNLLDKMVEWLSAKNTVEVDYTLKAGDGQAAGTLSIDGKRFRLRSDVMDAWYDGENQWSYSPSTGEVSVTNPTDEELQQVNPFAIIDAFRSAYTAGMKATNPESSHLVIVMTPKEASADITRVEVSVPRGQLYPARIVVWTASGETLAINTTRIIRGKSYTDADFTYNRSIYPGAEIIDLR